jgi:hypothetical protein
MKKNSESFISDPDFVEKMEEPVKPLVPHEAETRVEVMTEVQPPTILLSLESYTDIHYIMEGAGSNEVGWLGTVQKLDDNRYLIGRVFLFDQRVSGTHCEFDQGSIGKFYADMLKQDRANKAVLSSILFWGHLHPGDMIEPSGQDDEQMELFAHNPFFIRGIFTRGGKCVFDFFDYTLKVKITDCPWLMHLGDDDRRKTIVDEIKAKVKDGSFYTESKGGRHARKK